MESIFRIPTSKTPTTHPTSRDDRLRIQTLYFETAWEIDDIALQLNLTRRQIEYALEHQPTPQYFRCGRHILLDTLKQKQLIE